MNRKENSGYQKTHQRIKESLLFFIENKDLKDITVGQICELAKVNRSTFYAHYQDIYEVMEQIQREKEEDLLAAYGRVYMPGNDIISGEYMVVLLEHIFENRIFYKAMCADTNAHLLQGNMNLLYEKIFSPFFEKIGLSKRQGKYHFLFFQEGFLAMLRYWLTDDCPERPEEMAKILENSIPKYPGKFMVF